MGSWLVVSPLSVITTFIFYSQYTNDVGKALQRLNVRKKFLVENNTSKKIVI